MAEHLATRVQEHRSAASDGDRPLDVRVGSTPVSYTFVEYLRDSTECDFRPGGVLSPVSGRLERAPRGATRPYDSLLSPAFTGTYRSETAETHRICGRAAKTPNLAHGQAGGGSMLVVSAGRPARQDGQADAVQARSLLCPTPSYHPAMTFRRPEVIDGARTISWPDPAASFSLAAGFFLSH